MKTFIIVPAYNEEKRIDETLRKIKDFLKRKKLDYKIIVVDDGSEDSTAEIAKKEGVIVLKHIINLGKGASLKTGCDYAFKKGADIVVVMDADGQHDPAEIKRFVSILENKEADMVFGSRSLNSKMPFVRRLGNLMITFATKILFGVKLDDVQSGYRAFTADAYRKIRWQARGYAVEAEMVANVGKHKLKYKEIQISTIYLDRYKGMNVVEGMKIALQMLWWGLTK